jgi:ligand-binding sensor domain-containing protein/two-component sensor histidine kinase
MRSILSLFILFLFTAISLSQPDDYIFKQLTDADGLSQSTIFATIQDRIGYLWFGTIDGLNRYDGYEFKVYSNENTDSTSISDNFVSALYEDSDGYIWAGTVNGYLNKFDPNRETFERFYINKFSETLEKPSSSFYDYPLAFSRNQANTITAIREDSKGYLWVGMWGKGIIRFDRKLNSGTHIYNDPENSKSLVSNRIFDILIDSEDAIWIASFGGGLNKLKPDYLDIEQASLQKGLSFTNYCHNRENKHSLSDDKVVCLFEDNKKNLWIGTYLGGLNKLDYDNKKLTPEKAKFKVYKNSVEEENCISNNTVMAIQQDFEGYLWIGTFGGGIDRFDFNSESFKHFTKVIDSPNPLFENEILSLFIDRSGILWVGSHLGEGVTKIQKNIAKFDLITSQTPDPKRLNDDVVWSVFKDSKQNLWVGTYNGGLNFFSNKDNRNKIFKVNPDNIKSLSDNHIRSITEDNEGNIWIGTYSGGLNIIDPISGSVNKYQNVPFDNNSITANQVLDIYFQSDTVIWLATFGGGLNKLKISQKDKDSYKFFAYMHNPDDPNSISDDRAYTILHDSRRNFWIGTYGGGINKFDPARENFIAFRNDPDNTNSITNDKVLCMLEDSNGKIWIGTSGGGLNSFDTATDKFKGYSSRHGLTSAVVYGILEDDNKFLWLSTDNGIYKFNPQTEKFIQFGLEDGLQSLEFSGGAYFKDSEGIMYFGGIKGLNYFHPDSIKVNYYKPQVVINSIKILDEELKGKHDELILSHNENFISIEFSALDYSQPLRNRYRYILEGFQKYWTNTDAKQRIATYTNLPAGEYVFKVMGTNSDGVWNENFTSLKISINPPFYQTWWFATLAMMLVGFLLYYLSTLRIKNQLAIERIKTKIASDLHDNVGAGLTEISILSELAVQSSNKVNNTSGELRKISDTSRQLVDVMSDIVWVVNPERDSLYDLIIKLKDSYNELFNSVGISLQVKNVEKSNDIKLPMEYKQNLLLIFKEAINNSIKHSKCKKLNLEADVRNDDINIFIKDDGIGFNSEKIQYGNGMKNMINRAKNIGGEISWSSLPDKGTKVHFRGKLSKINKLKSFFNI